MQAAAEGLSKFRVGKEEHKAGNKAREDVRGYMSDPFTDNYEFALPQEVKKDYRLTIATLSKSLWKAVQRLDQLHDAALCRSDISCGDLCLL